MSHPDKDWIHVKNYMEDVVFDLLQALLEDREGVCACRYCRADMAAYALNRITPWYTVGERGVTHLYLQETRKSQTQADIIGIVNEGIIVVSNDRRKGHAHPPEESDEHEGDFFFNFPHIVGQVYDAVSFDPVFGAQVKLLQKGELVPQGSARWVNPYTTNEATYGTYNFWPKPAVGTREGETKNFRFRLEYAHPSYRTVTQDVEVAVQSVGQRHLFPRRGHFIKVDLVRLEKT